MIRMSLYDIDGNLLIADDDGNYDTPYLSSAARNRMRHNCKFGMDSFEVIHTFAPFSEDYSTGQSDPYTFNMSQQEFYSTFYDPYLGYHDDLLVTKKNLGKDQSGAYDIWCYDFIPFDAKKKILLSSGEHGYELPASFGMARWVKEYMESDADVFRYMRKNVHVSIIPIINPWGFNENPKRLVNSDTVNINRNFNDWHQAWENYEESGRESTKKGAYPFSEAEARILANWLKNNAEAEFYIDCHTGVGISAQTYGDIWYFFTPSNINRNKLARAAAAMFGHIQSVYGNTPTVYANSTSNIILKHKYGSDVVGIPTITIEQPQNADTAYSTVPNNCSTAIKEYATQIHAYIVSQLQSAPVTFATISSGDLENGALSAQGMNAGSMLYRVRTTGYIALPQTNTIHIAVTSNKDISFCVVQYTVNDYATSTIKYGAWQKSGNVNLVNGAKYLRLVFSVNQTTENISPSDIEMVELTDLERISDESDEEGLLSNFAVVDGYICQIGGV